MGVTCVVRSIMVIGLVAVGCTDDRVEPGPTADAGDRPDRTTGQAVPLDAADAERLAEQVGDGRCDPLDPSHCLLPFPSDHFTVDADTWTRRRVNLPAGQLANAAGAPLDPTEWNRNDGFSPGSPMMARLGPVDLRRSGAPTLDDIGRFDEAVTHLQEAVRLAPDLDAAHHSLLFALKQLGRAEAMESERQRWAARVAASQPASQPTTTR